ncbi:MAG: hypothetical protein FWD15_04085 [Alphaproteobacteria bacterium]|nr:hypothetical protein [Alphaproteobacteria bacterium]
MKGYIDYKKLDLRARDTFDKQVVASYKSGLTSKQVGEKYSIPTSRALDILRRRAPRIIRSKAEIQSGLTRAQVEKRNKLIVNDYVVRKKPTGWIAKKRNLSAWGVCLILKKYNVKMRKDFETKNKIEQFQKEYYAGSSTIEIAKKHGVSISWVGLALREINTKMRAKSEALTGIPLEELEKLGKDITTDHEVGGKSVYAISEKYKLTKTMTRNILIRNGVEIRPTEYAKVLTRFDRKHEGAAAIAITVSKDIGLEIDRVEDLVKHIAAEKLAKPIFKKQR